MQQDEESERIVRELASEKLPELMRITEFCDWVLGEVTQFVSIGAHECTEADGWDEDKAQYAAVETSFHFPEELSDGEKDEDEQLPRSRSSMGCLCQRYPLCYFTLLVTGPGGYPEVSLPSKYRSIAFHFYLSLHSSTRSQSVKQSHVPLSFVRLWMFFITTTDLFFVTDIESINHPITSCSDVTPSNCKTTHIPWREASS